MDNLNQSSTNRAKTAKASAPPRRDTDAVAMGPESAPSLLWMVIFSVALVLLMGLCLFVAREGLVLSLDGIAPSTKLPTPQVDEVERVETSVEPTVTESEPAQELKITCSLEDIETAVFPLLEDTEELLLAGRSEIGRFKGMSGQGGSAQALRNQWAGWGGIWRNRVALIRTALPSQSACAELEALAPTCDTVDCILLLLEQVPSLRSVSEADENFSQAQDILDAFRRRQEEAAELALLEEEIAAENLAAVEAALATAQETDDDQPASVPP